MSMAYRLVLEGKCTLGELEVLSIDDVDVFGMALDAWQDAERAARK